MKKSSQFLTVFVGEMVEILTDLKMESSIPVAEDIVQTVQVPLTVNGFVMDVDDTFVYLSPDGENVNQALPLNSIKHIAISEIKAPEDVLIDEMPDDGNFH